MNNINFNGTVSTTKVPIKTISCSYPTINELPYKEAITILKPGDIFKLQNTLPKGMFDGKYLVTRNNPKKKSLDTIDLTNYDGIRRDRDLPAKWVEGTCIFLGSLDINA